MKTQILAAIGENELQPAACLNAALAANDRVKYAFSLLQMASDHAEHPEQPAATLKRERIACGIDDPDLDTCVAAARMVGKSCRVPGAARILARIADDMRLMAAPVLATEPGRVRGPARWTAWRAASRGRRLLDPDAISAMTQAGHDRADSLHRLVMDLHKQLNAMQAELAEETLDGAAAYNLAEADRPLVAAFMAGLNRTAKLKFDHPGLATTATRAGDRLVIQNDIGTTDAHVIVIHVEGPGRQRHLYRCASRAAGVLPGHAETPRGDLGKRAHRACWPPARRSIWRPGASTRRMPRPAAPISNFSARAWCS